MVEGSRTGTTAAYASTGRVVVTGEPVGPGADAEVVAWPAEGDASCAPGSG